MSETNDEVTGPLDIGRRSLLKKAGAAGALGLAAPITFDSFFSPAAACSVNGFTQLTQYQSTGGSVHSTASITVPSGQLALISIAGGKGTSGGELSVNSVAGSAISSAVPVSSVEYVSPSAGRTTLSVYRASGTGTSGPVTVTFSQTVEAVHIAVSTIEVTASPNPVVAGVAAQGDDNTAEVSFAAVGPSSSEFFAVSGNSLTSHGWSMPSPWIELTDTYQGSGQLRSSISLATFLRIEAAAGQAQATATVNGVTLDRWGAIRLEINCA